MDFLPFRDVVRASATCAQWRRVGTSPRVWNGMLHRDFACPTTKLAQSCLSPAAAGVAESEPLPPLPTLPVLHSRASHASRRHRACCPRHRARRLPAAPLCRPRFTYWRIQQTRVATEVVVANATRRAAVMARQRKWYVGVSVAPRSPNTTAPTHTARECSRGRCRYQSWNCCLVALCSTGLGVVRSVGAWQFAVLHATAAA